MAKAMNADKRFYPHLGESLGIYLEVFGYRLARRTTVYSLGRDIFGADDSGLRKRFIGQVGVSAAEMSQLVVALELDQDGIYPEDFAHPPDALRSKMKSLGVGIYGRRASMGLHRAILGYGGPQGSVGVARIGQRSSAFTSRADDPDDDRWDVLRVNEAFRFVCKGPPETRLFLLDHMSEAADAALLCPLDHKGWARPDEKGQMHVPNRDEGPLRVRDMTGNRFVSALWFAPDVAAKLNTSLPVADAPDADAPEFRTLGAGAIQTLIKSLEMGAAGPVKAAQTQIYRIEPA